MKRSMLNQLEKKKPELVDTLHFEVCKCKADYAIHRNYVIK